MITDENKTYKDIINVYEKERLTKEKADIVAKLADKTVAREEADILEERLAKIVLEIAKLK